MFTAADYRYIHSVVFNPSLKYPGYRPNVIESPNGDGNWDTEKRYAHVAEKYQSQFSKGVRMESSDSDIDRYAIRMRLDEYLDIAHNRSVEIAIELGVPREFWPDRRYGALRILEYPPGSVTHPHVDFDLFTLMCYRNLREDFEYVGDLNEHWCPGLETANKLNDQIHFGEILELIVPDYKATPHEVKADSLDRTQYSIVYFSIPNHDAVLPDGQTVGQWIDERVSRSRRAA